jgi:riboflavin kinase
MHDFKGRLFYDENLEVLVMGYIRDERGDYQGVEELVEDIHFDVKVAENSLGREKWGAVKDEDWDKL